MMWALSHTTWSPRKIWNCFDIVNGATPASGNAHFWDGEISWVGPADLGKLSSRAIYQGERNLTESGYKSCGTTFVPAGTIILSARAPIGHVAVAANRLCFNQGCKGLVPNADIFSEFAYWLILALKPKLEAAGQGTTFVELSRSKLKDITFLLPPLPEQRAIAAFLDRKCATIDEAVRIKEEQIRLLAERRQILIQEAVTRGLNPDAPMKDSGIDWIGQIPAHWEVKRLKHLGTPVIGLTYDPKDLCDADEGTLVLRSSNLQGGRFTYGDDLNVYVSMRIPEKLTIKRDDILICSRNGSRDLIGKCALATEQDCGASFGAFTTVFRSPINRYLFQILNSEIFKLLAGSFLTATINQLTTSNLNSIYVPVPPPAEQAQLTDYLETLNAKVRDAIALKQSQITALREYKTSLINAAVTGKIKVF